MSTEANLHDMVVHMLKKSSPSVVALNRERRRKRERNEIIPSEIDVFLKGFFLSDSNE